MNERRVELIQMLLSEDEEYFLVERLADRLHCSEKTLRNDLKYAADFLTEYSNIRLHRKPGYGIFLQGSQEERKRLLDLLQKNLEKPSDERLFHLAYELLVTDHPLTLQYFADRHFTNKTTVKKDLDLIADWLKPFEITLVSKQKVGLFLNGEETKRRSALANLPQLAEMNKKKIDSITRLFPSHEVDIVKSVLKRGDFVFTDETFDRLVIHILIMIKRIKQKKPILIPEQNQKFTDQLEYIQAQQLIKELKPYFALNVPESEAQYLAWHLMSGKKRIGDDVHNPFLDQIVTELIENMSDITKINFSSDHTLIQGLTTHLQPVLNRITYELPITNPLLAEIKKMYPYMFSMVILAIEKLQDLFSITLPEDEAAYIVLHFQASVERRKHKLTQKKRAIIVCHLGIGMSHLLRSRIERHIPELQIEHCISRAEIAKYPDHDFIISTIELPEVKIPHIVVSPLFDLSDQDRLHALLKSTDAKTQNMQQFHTLLQFIDEDSIFMQVEFEHRYEVVEMLANALYDHGFVKKEYVHSAILRERMSATTIGSEIAMPHGSPSYIIRSALAVAVLREPLEWGSDRVSLVFLLAVVHEEQRVIKQLFNEISFLSEQKELVTELTQQTNKADFLKILAK